MPGDVTAHWEALGPLFEDCAALSRGDVTAERLAEDVQAARRQCYVAVIDGEVKGCALTRINPAGWLHVDFCAGRDADEWGVEMLCTFLAWAKDKGWPVTAAFRRGWARKLPLKELGFRETHMIMEARNGQI